MVNYILIAAFWIIVISFWLVFCVSKYRKWARRKKNCTKEVTVEVVDVLEKKTRRGFILHKPVFKPTDTEDQTLIETAYYSDLVSFEVGDRLELLVNPENPGEFLYKDDKYNKGKRADMAGCLLMLVVFIVWMILAKIKK